MNNKIKLTIELKDYFPNIFGYFTYNEDNLYANIQEDLDYLMNDEFKEHGIENLAECLSELDIKYDKYREEVQKLILHAFNIELFNATLSKDSDHNCLMIDVEFTFKEFCEKFLEHSSMEYLDMYNWESMVTGLISLESDKTFNEYDLYDNYPIGYFSPEWVLNYDEIVKKYNIKWN